MITLIVTLVLLAIALAAPIWGVDSRDGIESLEYERRRDWRGPW